MLLCLVFQALGAAAAPQRPLFPSRVWNESDALDDLKRYSGSNDDVLRKLALDTETARTPAVRLLQSLVGLRGKHPEAARLVDRILALGLADADRLSDAELVAQIDGSGAPHPGNHTAKLEAYYYALRYYLTGDEADARRVVALLDRFGEVMPRWPLVDPEGKLHSQADTEYYARWDATGLWGVWFYEDLWACEPLLFAWDLAGSSHAMQVDGVSKRLEDKLLRFMVGHQFKYSPTYGNLENYILEGLVTFGLVLPEPEYIHRVVTWHRAVLLTQFYADGFWHEGTPAYHKDIWWGLARTLPRMLQGYSDPPGFVSTSDGTRFDNLDLVRRYAPQMRRLEEALDKLVLPDGSIAGIHDAFDPDYRAWWTTPPTAARPRLLGSTGNGILGLGDGADQMLALLHFGGMHGHEHYDTLNVLFWAKQYEVLSETMYRPLPGDISTREWHEATAAHNTVVIDGRNQAGRFENERRRLTPEDAVPGIPDGRYRAYGHGDSVSDGRLLLFEPTLPEVQVIEADGERAYMPRPDLCRRTLALVRVDEADGYLFDVFRVRGGAVHDWMIHGCLQSPYEVRFDRALAPRDGSLHGYLKELQSFRTDADFALSFDITEPASAPQTRVTLMGQPGTEVIQGLAPAMRRRGLAPFVDVRHPGPESMFVAIHEPRRPGHAIIRKVEFARLAPMAVAVRVTLADGRTDILVSTADEPGAPAREVAAWGVALRGRFAFARLRGGEPEWLSLVRGDSFAVDGQEAAGARPYTGEIIATTRTEDGAAEDTLTASVPLPAGRSLAGRALLLDFGGLLTQSVIIDRVEADGGRARIVTRDDPGFTLQGGLSKLQHFPNWGIPGPCRFTIENPQHVRLSTGDGTASGTPR
jgi:hypothetical protein